MDGFAFQFSRSTKDGGKADLVENKHEVVEGKVYQIPHDAVRYLYKREGVYAGAYRPAIVPVLVNDLMDQAITFIGVEKSPETAPTQLYATEILRGGNDFLSEEYLNKIRWKIGRF
ncbi:gamma-glutamylcyclotransferase [Virgibacillus doumboii]|uniref:gamma-glutamylcyclotransferase n=1 Tax=Virgibacillus doumboii TaxID=2697503 RepID=UPI0013E01535|nr:gamma-glutamylcyclotransferase [Virgibacillus doumboii]